MGLFGSNLVPKAPATSSASSCDLSAGKIEQFGAEIGSGEPREGPAGARRPGAPLFLLSLSPFVMVGKQPPQPSSKLPWPPPFLCVCALIVGEFDCENLSLDRFFALCSPVGFSVADFDQKRPRFVRFVHGAGRVRRRRRCRRLQKRNALKEQKDGIKL